MRMLLPIVAIMCIVSCAEQTTELDNSKTSPVQIMTDKKMPIEKRRQIIADLKQKGDWKTLLNAVPAMVKDGDDGLAAEAITGVKEIGNSEALPELTQLKKSLGSEFVSGEFWAILDDCINHLDRPKSDDE